MKSFSEYEKLNSLLLALAMLLMLCAVCGLNFGFADAAPAIIGFLLMFFAERRLGRKGAAIVGVSLLITAVLAFVLMGMLRSGATEYARHVFSASEAVNRYRYIELKVQEVYAADTALAAFRAVLSFALETLLYLLSLPAAAFLLPAAAFAIMTGFSAFFGLSPSPLYLCIFGLALLICLLSGGKGHLDSIAKGGIIALYLAVCVVSLMAFGGVDEALEARSEDVRDRLSYSFVLQEQDESEIPQEENLTHKESRLQEAEASGEDSSQRPDEFNKNTEYQQEISKPRQVDYAKMVLMLFLSILLIVVPFVIIFFVVRAQRRASAYRSDFESEDSNLAARAIFRHIAELISAGGRKQGNINYSELEDELCKEDSIFGADFSDSFRRALKDWQLASYSLHSIDPEEKSFLIELSNQAERCLYEAADRKKRFRLRFID
ncbi:MAG: hypothetical protein IJM08_03385, partial [Firmicutes bacterium]|nr:hypothetical protein [Bacillota bacterium]